MLTPQNIKLQADKVADLYEQLQQQIFYLLIDATKDTRSLMEEHGRELEWRLKMLQKMGGLSKQVVKLVSQTSGLSERQIMELVEKNGLTVAKDINKQLAETLGQHQPISQDVRSIVSSYARQTGLNIDNNVNQTLITTNYANNTAVKMFQDIINKTTLDLISGKRSGPQAMTDNILKWQDKGIKSTFVDKGGHNWSLEGYTRTVLDTTAQRVFNDVRIQSMKDFDSVLITMTSHPASRPACAPIQGHVVNIVPESDPRFDPEFDTIYNHGYGEPAGCFGINCQHMPYPYIKGVSHNFQKQYDPDEAVKNANIQAKQRYYERKVRALKKKLGVCDRIGDEERGMQIKGSIRSYQAKLRQIVKENGFLARDYSRERVYNSGSQKAIKVQSGAKNYVRDTRYDKFIDKEVIRRKKYAFRQYDAIKNSNQILEQTKIFNNVQKYSEMKDFSKKDIEIAFNHVFNGLHDLYEGRMLFTPDPEMADSWTRLISGKNVQPHDLVLLRHERMERDYMLHDKMDYDEAHEKTNKFYNYSKLANDFDKKGSE